MSKPIRIVSCVSDVTREATASVCVQLLQLSQKNVTKPVLKCTGEAKDCVVSIVSVTVTSEISVVDLVKYLVCCT